MTPDPDRAASVRAMLEARSIAVVGASARPGGFGDRLLTELGRSPSRPDLHLVNPRYEKVGSRACLSSLEEIPGPVDLVALAVGDDTVEEQVSLAATRGDRSIVIFASAFDDPVHPGRRQRIQATADAAGMALCGAGCMGFINVEHGLRAIGYLEPHPLPAGPIALVTHSGSAFSALLRADRRLGWTLAVSSGQELVTATADYLDYAVGLDGTRVVALLLETLRRPDHLRAALLRAADAGVTVVTLTVGASPGGRRLVQAHSGALAGDDATWEALCEATGMLRVGDLAEMADTLELFAAGRRRPGPSVVAPSGGDPDRRTGRGVATVHDSGAERALAGDVAHDIGLPFAGISAETTQRLAGLLDRGVEPGNPLDVWGAGAGARRVLAGSLIALAADPAVDAVALCIDLVPEYDGDESYEQAITDAWASTATPLCVLSNLPSAIDRDTARRLRTAGVPVLEGTRSGLLALRHLRSAPPDGAPSVTTRRAAPAIDDRRGARWRHRLRKGPLGTVEEMRLLTDYGIGHPAIRSARSRTAAMGAADEIGYPVVVKTDRSDIVHKSDVAGVLVGLSDTAAVGAAYDDLSDRLGPEVVVMAMAGGGVDLALGLVRDPLLGPVVVVGAGGVLVELMADRRVGLPPLDVPAAVRLIDGLRMRPVLDGIRGGPAADVDAIAAAVVGLSAMAAELGDIIMALDVNPLRCGPDGVLALDVLVETADRS